MMNSVLCLLRRSVVAVLGVALLAAGCSTVSESAPSNPTKTTHQVVAPVSSTTTLPVTTTSALAPPGTLLATVDFGIQLSPCGFGVVNGWPSLPDRRCTPGTVDPKVTQDTIHSTICVTGYTSTVRPSSSVTEREKIVAMRAYAATGSTGDYEYDHLVSLELGGSPNVAANLFPEPYGGPYGARVKDRLENRLHDLVCSGSISLATAQYQEATDWISAYRQYVGPLP